MKDFLDNHPLIRAALIRAGRTAAQTAAAMMSTAVFTQEVDWCAVLSASALAGLYSLLTSITTGLPETDSGSGAEGGDAP